MRIIGKMMLTVIVFAVAGIIGLMLLFIVGGGGFGARYNVVLANLLAHAVVWLGIVALLFLIYGGFKKKKLRLALAVLFAVWCVTALAFGARVIYNDSLATVSEGESLSSYRPYSENNVLAVLDDAPTIAFPDNYPSMDGATALYPVYASFAQALYPEEVLYPEETQPDRGKLVTCSTTTEAYRRIVNGDVDVIFVAEASEKQMEYAKEKGIELIFTPIGSEAFVFFVNASNPIENITVEQVRGIYSGKIKSWSELGVSGMGRIRAFQRDEGSGSQTAIKRVMGDTPLMGVTETENVSASMGGMVSSVANYRNYRNAIGYSFRYYLTRMVDGSGIKILPLEGVSATEENIANGTYPICGNFYAVTRSNASKETQELVAWICSEQGQELIKKTGYTPLEAGPE
ncbi:MAG: substrate-binding domain-containing protein [Lachnospiraceae bacterium]|nr:substrate-binding domain-containing protein [Lachnospiraceae bacterium]MBR0093332.1 substrate-binding domain-containing protein [Lachnospiraceae bacterium]